MELGYDARTEATQYEGELSEINANEQEKSEAE